MDGSYNFGRRSISLVAGPLESHLVLRALQEALRLLEAGAPNNQIVSEISSVSPKLGIAAEKAAKVGGKSLLAALIVLLIGSCTMKTEVKLDVNRLFEQAMYYIAGSAPAPLPTGVEKSNEPGHGAEKTEDSKTKDVEKAKPSRQLRRQQERRAKKQMPKLPRKGEPK